MCNKIEITWDDTLITWDDVPYDIKEMVEYGVYTKEEAIDICDCSRKRYRKYIDISENNT